MFARAALHVDQLRPDTVIRWLYTTTTNYCLNLIRDRKRRRELLDEQEPRPKEITSTADALLTLRALLSKANEQEARAATYIYIDQLSQPEAADLMGISVRKLGYLLASFREWARTQVSENNK